MQCMYVHIVDYDREFFLDNGNSNNYIVKLCQLFKLCYQIQHGFFNVLTWVQLFLILRYL